MHRRLVKIVFVVLLILTAFHLSGIESAFCDDGFSHELADSHGCSMCHPGNHSVHIEPAIITITENSGSFFSFEDLTLLTKEPTHFIFRPPILA